jgi:hypothetical protein
MESGYISTPSYDVGNRSRRIMPDLKKPQQEKDKYLGPVRTESLRMLEGKRSYEVLKAAWDRGRESPSRRS